jgi:hypothetical protein
MSESGVHRHDEHLVEIFHDLLQNGRGSRQINGEADPFSQRFDALHGTRQIIVALTKNESVPACTNSSTKKSGFEIIRCASSGRCVTLRSRASLHQSSRLALELLVTADQVVGRTVMAELWLRLALELGDDALGQNLAEFDAPLIEGIDVPDGALGEHAVLV